MENIFKRRRAKGLATVLAIGTANPPNYFYQTDYPDFYFKITQSHHLKHLKDKFKRICQKSNIKKRYMYVDEDIIKKNPNISIYKAASLDARQEILVPEVPKLGKEAALRAIKEWRQPISKITHLVFSTSSSINMPGADYELVKLLGLQLSVKRLMLYQQGCSAGVAALRLAKDIAENNVHSRILVVCSEITSIGFFHAPSDTHLDILVGSAIFSDGAAAVIVGADPDTSIEKPLFEVVSASQTIIPGSWDDVACHTREMGISYYLSKNVSQKIGDHILQCMEATLSEIGWIQDLNSLFYVVHPGGQAILKILEEKLGLDKEKLEASRHVLSEYGNMVSPGVLFVLDEMKRRSLEQGKATTGEGLDFGVMVGFSPGLTVETLVLSSVTIDSNH